MKILTVVLVTLSLVTSVQAQCLLCSAIEKKFRQSCEAHWGAMADTAEKYPNHSQFVGADVKQLRSTASTYCKCSYDQLGSILPNEIEIFVELHSMQAKTYSSIGAALAGDLSAVREYEAAEKAVNEFGAKMARMIGKDRLEKISWLTQKACSPMIEKYLPGPH